MRQGEDSVGRGQNTVMMPNSRHSVSLRAIVIGAIGAALVCLIVCWGELVVSTIQIAICQFAPAAIGLLLIIVLINLLIGWLGPRFALRPHEVIIIYVMIVCAALTVSRGLLERWLPGLVAVNYYANPTNHWDTTFFEHIPQWGVPFDVRGEAEQPVVRDFYEGLRPGAPIPWRPWLTPWLAWLVPVFAMLFSYACLAAIIREQWVDNEKLSFPLTILPLEMAEHSRWSQSFFSNWLTWIGFIIPTFVFTLAGLHRFFPSIPEIPVQYRLNQMVFNSMGRPWRDLGHTTAYCSMAAVGFGYFLPAQVLFSLWAFFVFARVQEGREQVAAQVAREDRVGQRQGRQRRRAQGLAAREKPRQVHRPEAGLGHEQAGLGDAARHHHNHHQQEHHDLQHRHPR